MVDRRYEISSYREGFYQPNNGVLSPEPLFAPHVISKWEEFNNVSLGGKGWGVGQALFFKDGPLVFGRNAEMVDIVIDRDPTVAGEISSQQFVSGVHFEITPKFRGPSYGPTELVIKDLGSTNGTYLYEDETGSTRLIERLSHFLVLDDCVTFCDNPMVAGLHPPTLGFRVCRDAQKGFFLVKFNFTDRQDFIDMLIVL